MKTGATPGIRRAVNSKKPKYAKRAQFSYDADIWDNIVKGFCEKHKISEYNFNRIITISFPSWGIRRPYVKNDFCTHEKGLSESAGDKVWVYVLNSQAIMDSLMGWKRFSKTVDTAIKNMKGYLKHYNKLYAARKTGRCLEPLEAGFNTNDVSEDNLLYGIYSDDDEAETY